MTTQQQTGYDLLDQIGNTPLIRLMRAVPSEIPPEVEIYAKAEWFNPGGSVKDRPALQMVREALDAGAFQPGQVLIDSTSGNTGVAYAMIGACMGFPVELVMPTNVSPERKTFIAAYGAQITYSDPLKGSDGARDLAQSLIDKNPQMYYFPDQYSNSSNWQAHYLTTGPEIWNDTEGRITHLVCGMGTSGTIMGTSRYLKEKNPTIRAVALQPEPFHGIEGWKNMDSSTPVRIYDADAHDSILTLPTEPAYFWAKELAKKEGLFVSPSSGAAFYGALQVAKKMQNGVIVVVFADGGDRYFSTKLWEK